MKLGTSRTLKWTAPLLVAACASSVGCKSGWKMPGASLLSWNRQPSAETMASNLNAPQLPTSPATKYTPTSVASAASGSKSTAPTGAVNSTAPSAISPYSTVSTPVNSSATANGYQTGPYSTGSNAYGGNPGTSASSTPNASTSPYGGNYAGTSGLGGPGQSSAYSASGLASNPKPNAGYASPSPYAPAGAGGLPSLTPTAQPAINSLTASPSTSQSPVGGTTSPTAGFSMPNLATSGISSMPSHIPQSVSVGGGTNHAMTPVAYPLPPASSIPATSAAPDAPQLRNSQAAISQVPSAGGLPTVPSFSAAATPNSFPQTQNASAYAGSTTVSPSSYRPGTTGRSTTYNFATPANTGSPAASPAYPSTANNSVTAPPSTPYPTTTNYSNYGVPALPSYGGSNQLPPNTASGSGPGVSTPTLPNTIYR